MEPNNGGLVRMIFPFTWVILRFHVDFQGCKVLAVEKLWIGRCRRS